jgi:hypothetical protein
LTPPAAAIAAAPQPLEAEPAATDSEQPLTDPAAVSDEEATQADEMAKAGSPAAAQETEVLATPPEGSPQMFLLFIQWSDEPLRRVASLRSAGGRLAIVKEGDIVEGMKVMAIRRDAVEFQWRGSTFRVGPVRAAPPA